MAVRLDSIVRAAILSGKGMTGYRLIAGSDVALRLCRDVKRLKDINGDIDAEYEALVAEYDLVAA